MGDPVDLAAHFLVGDTGLVNLIRLIRPDVCFRLGLPLPAHVYNMYIALMSHTHIDIYRLLYIHTHKILHTQYTHTHKILHTHTLYIYIYIPALVLQDLLHALGVLDFVRSDVVHGCLGRLVCRREIFVVVLAAV